jgi:glucosyl-dolichyl phosphate glucuronosyltransferase
MNVSIIICTRDRADSLRETLASIGRCEVPADLPAELLVVDNGSTDHTRQVVEQAVLRNMPVQYILEPRRGLSHARNRGMAEAEGGIFLWTDDDVRVPRGWIEGMCRPIISGESDAVAGGVRLAGHLDRPWLVGELRGWVACTEGLIDPVAPSRMVGANMAFGRRVLDHVPRFDLELGAGALGSHEETVFTEQLIRSGFRVAGALHVVVEHHPDESRLTCEAFALMAVAMGRSAGYRLHHWCHRRIRFPHLRLGYHYLSSWIKHHLWQTEPATGGPRAGYLWSMLQVGLFSQYLREMRRPPNYGQDGPVEKGQQHT